MPFLWNCYWNIWEQYHNGVDDEDVDHFVNIYVISVHWSIGKLVPSSGSHSSGKHDDVKLSAANFNVFQYRIARFQATGQLYFCGAASHTALYF